MTKEELKNNFLKSIINLRNKNLIEQDCLIDVFEDVIQPYITELENENKTVARKADEAIADKLLMTATYNEVLNDLNQENDKLQKENKILEGKLADSKLQNESLSETIKVREKENAELKDYRLKTLAENQTDVQKYAVNLEHKLSWYDEQLLKAKEHIENLLYYVKQCTCERSNYAEIKEDIKQAEQFLSDEVEK